MPRKPKQPTNNALLRQWAMLRLIPRWPRRISTIDLLERLVDKGFHVELRTVQRDLNKLADVLPFAGDNAKPQGWGWLPDAGQFDIPGLDPHTALAFHMAERYLIGVLPKSTIDRLKPWFNVARGVLDDHTNGLAKWPGKVRVLPRGLPRHPPAISPEIQSAVYESVLQDRKLKVTYQREIREGAPERPSHVVSPLALVVRDGAVYLVCVFEGYTEPRQLALHRIRKAEVLGDDAQRPRGFSIDTYIAEGEFGIPINPRAIRFEARFARKVAIHLRESPVSSDQVITDVDATSVAVRATVPDTLELRQWIQSFGDEVEVIKPTSLRIELEKRLMAAYAQYV